MNNEVAKGCYVAIKTNTLFHNGWDGEWFVKNYFGKYDFEKVFRKKC